MFQSPVVLLCILLFWFPIPAAMNDHTGLVAPNHTHVLSYSPGGQKSEIHRWARVKVSGGPHSFVDSREESISLSLPASRAACVPWLTASFLHHHGHQGSILKSVSVLTLALCFCRHVACDGDLPAPLL